MSRPASGNRKTVITFLNDTHREVLRRLALGQSQRQVSESLGVSTATISRLRCSPCGIEFIERVQSGRDDSAHDAVKTVAEELDATAPEAVEVLKKAVRGELKADRHGCLRLRASMDLLDRAGFPKAHRIENGQKPYVDAAKLPRQDEGPCCAVRRGVSWQANAAQSKPASPFRQSSRPPATAKEPLEELPFSRIE